MDQEKFHEIESDGKEGDQKLPNPYDLSSVAAYHRRQASELVPTIVPTDPYDLSRRKIITVRQGR